MPPAPKPPKYDKVHARHEWNEFRKAANAWAISCALLLAGIALVGGFDKGEIFGAWIMRPSTVLAIWLLFPLSYQFWPPKQRG